MKLPFCRISCHIIRCSKNTQDCIKSSLTRFKYDHFDPHPLDDFNKRLRIFLPICQQMLGLLAQNDIQYAEDLQVRMQSNSARPATNYEHLPSNNFLIKSLAPRNIGQPPPLLWVKSSSSGVCRRRANGSGDEPETPICGHLSSAGEMGFGRAFLGMNHFWKRID